MKNALITILMAGLAKLWAYPHYHLKEVEYHRAPDYRGILTSLMADLYIPLPDSGTSPLRPALILVHGGGFEIGSRRDSFLVHMADFFASRGFFVASIEYRLGLPPRWEAHHWIEANVRAVQDLRTFIRYLKAQAAHGNPYQIDTTKIIALGWSAGAFTVLHAAFLNSLEELSMVSQADTAQIRKMGGLYGEAYPEHSSDFWMAINLFGALYRLEWIQSGKISHLVSIHPEADSVVKPHMQYSSKGIIWYGSHLIDSAAKVKGISSFYMTMDMPYCKWYCCHAWQGDHSYVSFGTPIIESYVYNLLLFILKGEEPPSSYRYVRVRPTQTELAQGCVLRLLGKRRIRRECKALLSELTPTWSALITFLLLVILGGMQIFITLMIRRSKVPNKVLPDYAPQVFIPVRNDFEELHGLLESLFKQTLPLSIIVGDDNSQSEPPEKTKEFNVSLFRVPSYLHDHYPAKHAVLAFLEEYVETPIFFVADADMRFPPRWAQTLYNVLTKQSDLGGVCAPSLPRENSLWEAFQRIEWASTLYLIAARQTLGKVTTAIGNSMALKKEAWEKVGGWKALSPSFVEDYEMLRALETNGWRFAWVWHPDALGETRAESTFHRWLQQRLRWRHAVRKLDSLAVSYWILQSTLPWAILLTGTWFSTAVMLCLWAGSEALPLWRFRQVVGAKRLMRYLPLLLIYRFLQGPWLLWLRYARRPIEWKGRQYIAIRTRLRSND